MPLGGYTKCKRSSSFNAPCKLNIRAQHGMPAFHDRERHTFETAKRNPGAAFIFDDSHRKGSGIDFPLTSPLMNPFVPLENPQSFVSLLSDVSMFGGLTDAQRTEILRRVQVGKFKRGQNIFQEGDDPSHIYLVKSGLVGLFISDKEVKIEKKRLGKGECFGHVALISITRHNLSAVAVVDSEILVISKELLQQLRHEDSELFSLLMLNIARELARRLQYTDDLLLKAMHGPKSAKELPAIVGQ